MVRYFLSPILILLPIIVLFSGMAMTPVLILFTLAGMFIARRQLWADLKGWYAADKLRARYYALLLLIPLAISQWSLTPDHSLSTAIAVAVLGVVGILGLIAGPRLPAPSPRVWYYMGAHIALVGGILLLERALPHGLLHEICDLLGKDYERFMNKNINRGLCALTVFIWPVVFWLQRTGQTRIALWSVGLLLVGILAMHSLSAKLGLFAGVVAFLAVQRCPKWAPRALAMLLPLFLLSFPLIFKLAENTIFETTTVLQHLPLSSLHRVAIWDIDMHFIEQKWLFGYGMDATRALPMTPEELTALGLGEPPMHPHNPSVQILLEFGVVGLVLVVGFLYLLLRKWQNMEEGMARTTIGALIVSYFVSGLFSFGIWQSWWIASLWIALILWRWGTKHTA